MLSNYWDYTIVDDIIHFIYFIIYLNKICILPKVAKSVGQLSVLGKHKCGPNYQTPGTP